MFKILDPRDYIKKFINNLPDSNCNGTSLKDIENLYQNSGVVLWCPENKSFLYSGYKYGRPFANDASAGFISDGGSIDQTLSLCNWGNIVECGLIFYLPIFPSDQLISSDDKSANIWPKDNHGNVYNKYVTGICNHINSSSMNGSTYRT